MEDQITGEGAIEIAISLGMSRRGGDDNSLVTFHVVVLWRSGVGGGGSVCSEWARTGETESQKVCAEFADGMGMGLCL